MFDCTDYLRHSEYTIPHVYAQSAIRLYEFMQTCLGRIFSRQIPFASRDETHFTFFGPKPHTHIPRIYPAFDPLCAYRSPTPPNTNPLSVTHRLRVPKNGLYVRLLIWDAASEKKVRDVVASPKVQFRIQCGLFGRITHRASARAPSDPRNVLEVKCDGVPRISSANETEWRLWFSCYFLNYFIKSGSILYSHHCISNLTYTFQNPPAIIVRRPGAAPDA